MTIRAAALAVLAASALSSAAHAETRQPVAASFTTRGLDLATVEGRARLATRIDRAAAQACYGRDPVQAGKAGLPRDARCIAEVRGDAAASLAALHRQPRVEVGADAAGN